MCQFNGFAGAHWIVLELARRLVGDAGGAGAVGNPGAFRHVLVEESHLDSEGLGHLEEIAGADAVAAVFVLLDLLESDADAFSELGLAHADADAAGAQARTHVLVDGVG